MHKNPKSARGNAERAAEHYAIEELGCVETRRAIASKFQKVDFFSCDVMGVRPDGSKVWIQVTSGRPQAVTARKRKIEAHRWHSSEQVMILQLCWEPGKGNKKNWYFNQFAYFGKEIGWIKYARIEVKKEWFKAYRKR